MIPVSSRLLFAAHKGGYSSSWFLFPALAHWQWNFQLHVCWHPTLAPPSLFGRISLALFYFTLPLPFISRPILGWSLTSFASYSISVFYGSLVSVILLFAIPMILLGCVSPFAIRLTIERVGKSGRTAGQLYAISTAGSILGTFLPVLWLIPTIGTYRTFFVFAVSLLLVSIVGLTVTRFGSSPPSPPRLNKSLLPILL